MYKTHCLLTVLPQTYSCYGGLRQRIRSLNCNILLNKGCRCCPFQRKHDCAAYLQLPSYRTVSISPGTLVQGSVLLQGPLSNQHPWLWKEVRLNKTNEASFNVSDDRHLMDPEQPCEDCSSAAPRMGIPLSHRTAAGFTTVTWVATPQSPLSLNYIHMT